MFFSVDPSDGLPIYEQIVRQVKFAVARGTLRGGQLLPSVRELSGTLSVNPNTVARAYRDLQTEGIVESLRGRGMVICKGAAAGCRRQRKAMLAERIETVLAEAVGSGLSPAEIETLVARQLKKLASAAAASVNGSDGQPP